MKHINLLPWREEQRRVVQRRFYQHSLAVAGAAALVLFLLVLDLRAGISDQRARNEFLRQQIQQIDTEIGQVQGHNVARKRMNERLALVRSLQKGRNDLVHIFDALPRTIPAGVVLEDIKQTGDAWKIRGIAASNNEISQFIRNLNDSPWFHSARLSEVSTGKQANAADSRFVLEVGSGHTEVKR